MSTTQPQTLPTDRPPSWQPDPTRRHQYRYFDGAKWTDHVADHGQSTKDPYTLQPPPLPVGPTVPAAPSPAPAQAPTASREPTEPNSATSANTQARAVSRESGGREVYGAGTWDFIVVLILCLLVPIVSLWYGPKLLFTGHVLRGLFVLAMTAVWFSMLIQTL